MKGEVLLNLKYCTECRLLEVSEDMSFEDLISHIKGTWSDLNSSNTVIRYTVQSISNCCLSNDDDLRNMIVLCKQLGAKLVNSYISKRIDCSPSACLMFDGPDGSPSESSKNSIYQSKLPENEKDEFNGICTIPIYEMCPVEKVKKNLSDNWLDSFNDGIGSVFLGGVTEFRKELIKYTVKKGFNFKYLRNDSRYVHVVCSCETSEECTWFIKARRQVHTTYFYIVSGHFKHTCFGDMVNVNLSRLVPNVIVDLVLQQVQNKPTICGTEVVSHMRDNYSIEIEYWKAWRTIEKARDKLFGSYIESYNNLRWYCESILRTNPGSVVELQKRADTNEFQRIFIAYKSSIDGFKYCRPMLFIDGTFMKGREQGTLLVATAKDGNNGLFPVAMAVVSSENLDNWEWFLIKLRDICKHDKEVCYISDRNTGLLSAFKRIVPEPVHFFCLYHLLGNLRGRFTGGLKQKRVRARSVNNFRDCAYAPNRRVFEEKLLLFKMEGGNIAEEWLQDLPFDKWAVAYSTNIQRYGEMTSNAAESYNSWIRQARGLPITYMLDYIRKEMCRWIIERRDASNLWEGILCKKKESLWHELSEIGKTWKVVKCPNGQFDVFSQIPVSVDIKLKVCTCYQWQIQGFPCTHAVAVIRKFYESVHGHIEECFFANNYRECYKFSLNSIPDTEKFECPSYKDITDCVNPPNLGRQPGRPKTKRNPSYGEYKRKAKERCCRCGVIGSHDAWTCSVDS